MISRLPESLAWITLRQMAAGAFSRPPSHVPCGPVFLAKHLGEQLLPAVPALCHGGIRIRFLERTNVGVLLEVGVVDARGGCKEISLRAGAVCSLDQMRVDQ